MAFRWTPETISATVTWQFACNHFLPDELERLNKPVGFGDGLTDGTYWQWIEKNAKRIFLILIDVGVPDQIFGVIDDNWDDEDLPIPLEQVDRLALTPAKDERFERRFYSTQFRYLLRPLQAGGHVIYRDEEVVPVELVDKKQGTDRVTIPNLPGLVFCRQRIPLHPEPGGMRPEDFQQEVNSTKDVQNEHLVSYWGSYIHQGWGYVILSPAADYSLKSFLVATPAQVTSRMEKQSRRELVMNLIHCLVHTLCYLHTRGLSHGKIKPSTVLFTHDGRIALADFTSLSPELKGRLQDKASSDRETYDYSAPEQWFKPSPTAAGSRKNPLGPVPASPSSDGCSNLDTPSADVFSMGCVVLELLSFLLKKHGKPFAAHRAAKHKSAGRGGAVPDSSFHKNIGQVESWMAQLAKDASKKNDRVLRGVAPMLHVVERMLALQPTERPSAQDVQIRIHRILTENSGISELHCSHQHSSWDDNLELSKLQSDNSSSFETASIQSQTDSSLQILVHERTNSGGCSRKAERPEELRNQTDKIGNGSQAEQNLPIKDRPPTWHNSIYAGAYASSMFR